MRGQGGQRLERVYSLLIAVAAARASLRMNGPSAEFTYGGQRAAHRSGHRVRLGGGRGRAAFR